MEGPIKMDVKLDATESVAALTKSCTSILDRVLNAVFGKAEADRWRHRMLTEAQTEHDIKAIISGQKAYQNGEIVPATDCAEAERLALPPHRCHEMAQEDKNLSDNVQRALDIIATDFKDRESVDAETPIEPDWFSRWRREAKVISDPIMQGIWGRILAEKAVSDAKISYQTLDVIKNISHDDALLFMEFSRYVVNGKTYPSIIHDLKSQLANIKLSQAQTLVDCGLLEPIRSTKFTYTKSEEYTINFSNFLIITNKETKLYGCFLTRSGRELFSIIDIEPATKEQAITMCDHIFGTKKFCCESIELYEANLDGSTGEKLYSRH